MKKHKHNAEEPEKEIINDTAQQEQEANQQTENQTTEEEGDKIADEIAELTQKCSDLNDKNLRLMAEFDNYRKRTLKERSDLVKTAGENILSSMLPLVDDFERALKAMETAEDIVAVKEGVDLIYGKFIAFLLQNGVKAIPTENEVFDTDLHEAITTFPAPTEDLKGKIIDCASKGYTLNEKVIRFSKVVVGE
ncbi:MAG: nucleotide exchange factor GrpE [Paludibacter sp.]|jgi:molecular chaperone GrpE|nr:nucleotide exchange factor GrpE [Paludibacter sp.]